MRHTAVAKLSIHRFLITLVALASTSASAAEDIPRMKSGVPDFTGMWAGPGFAHTGSEIDGPAAALYDNTRMAPFQPGMAERFIRATGDVRIDDPTAVCLPNGLTRQIASPYPQQWVQTDNELIILYEYMHFFRHIPLGEPNRPHGELFEDTYMGDSIAWFEGDTLVIDTIGLKEWLLDSFHPETGGSRWHSGQTHVVERISYQDKDNATYEVTIDDPVTFQSAWTQPWAMQRKQTWKLFEFICEDNNRCEAGVCQAADVQQDQ